MGNGFLKRLRVFQNKTFFTDEDLKILFSDKSENAIRCLVSHYVKKGALCRYKRGVYGISEPTGDKIRSKFSLANKLLEHSYVSFESALSFHGLIPEAVHEVSSACLIEKKKQFKNEMGIFSFRHSPVTPFFLEVYKDETVNALVARPMRALFDLVYSRRRKYGSLKNMNADLRIDLDELEGLIDVYSVSEIFKLGGLYKKRSTRTLAEILVKEYK